jgi:hypothetical protein
MSIFTPNRPTNRAGSSQSFAGPSEGVAQQVQTREPLAVHRCSGTGTSSARSWTTAQRTNDRNQSRGDRRYEHLHNQH